MAIASAAPAYVPAVRPEGSVYRATPQAPVVPARLSLPEQTAAASGEFNLLSQPYQEIYAPQPQQGEAPALWEAVRGFINTTRNAITTPSPVQPDDHHISEYTEMIEADMMRYRFESSGENLDISPQKKQG